MSDASYTQVTGKLDLIDRQAAIEVANRECHELRGIFSRIEHGLKELPSAEPEGKWTTEEVAEILFNAFGDDCACNFNGIDEWLPERCKYTEIADECPNPKEKHGCWMQFLLQGGADMRGEQE